MKRLIILTALATMALGCDSGPKGPGDLTATLQTKGVVVGGIVVQMIGSGIEGFSGAGGSKVFFAEQDEPGVYRVVVIGVGSGDLSFKVSVKDVGGRRPRATIVGAVDPNNLPLPATDDYQLKFSR